MRFLLVRSRSSVFRRRLINLSRSRPVWDVSLADVCSTAIIGEGIHTMFLPLLRDTSLNLTTILHNYVMLSCLSGPSDTL